MGRSSWAHNAKNLTEYYLIHVKLKHWQKMVVFGAIFAIGFASMSALLSMPVDQIIKMVPLTTFIAMVLMHCFGGLKR